MGTTLPINLNNTEEKAIDGSHLMKHDKPMITLDRVFNIFFL